MPERLRTQDQLHDCCGTIQRLKNVTQKKQDSASWSPIFQQDQKSIFPIHRNSDAYVRSNRRYGALRINPKTRLNLRVRLNSADQAIGGSWRSKSTSFIYTSPSTWTPRLIPQCSSIDLRSKYCFKFCILLMCMCVCLCICMCACVSVQQRPQEGTQIPWSWAYRCL